MEKLKILLKMDIPKAIIERELGLSAHYITYILKWDVKLRKGTIKKINEYYNTLFLLMYSKVDLSDAIKQIELRKKY